jgi:hypothetical protein
MKLIKKLNLFFVSNLLISSLILYTTIKTLCLFLSIIYPKVYNPNYPLPNDTIALVISLVISVLFEFFMLILSLKINKKQYFLLLIHSFISIILENIILTTYFSNIYSIISAI